MKLSRNNVAYDLTISPHRVTIPYEEGEVTYIFSSALYTHKFMEKRQKKREQIEQSLANRFGFAIDAKTLADLRCYIEIEKRGFLIEKDGELIECLNNLKLDGGKVTSKNSGE